METLAYIYTDVDNIASQGWYNRRSVRSSTAVGIILQDLDFLTRTHNIYSSGQKIAGANNKITDAASRLTHLTNKMFLQHFALTLLQKKTWRLINLTSGCRQHLTYILRSKSCFMPSQPQSSKNIPPPGANGASSANGWKSYPKSKSLDIPSISSRSLMSIYAPAFFRPEGYPSIICPWNSTFVPSGKYLQQWGPAIHGTTS